MTDPDPHLARVNSNHLDPSTLLQTKPFALDLADDESDDLVVTGRNQSHSVLPTEVVFHHLDPAAGDFRNDRLLDGNDLRNVFRLIFRVLIAFMRSTSLDPNDLHVLPHPLRGKVNPPAVSTLFHFLINHLLSVDLKLRFVSDRQELFSWRKTVCHTEFLLGHGAHGLIGKMVMN